MSAIALGTGVFNSTTIDATTHTTASFGPTAAGNFVLIVVHHTHGTTATPMTAPTGACLSSMQQLTAGSITATRSFDIWCGSTTASAGAITFHYNETATGATWAVQEFLNVDMNRGINNLISGLVANLASNNGVGTAASLAMRHQQHPANAFVAIWGSDSLGIDNNVEAGWTEIDDRSTATPVNISQTIDWRIGEDITPTSTFGGSVTWVGFGLELWGADASGNWSAIETFTTANQLGWGNDQLWTEQDGITSVLSNQGTAGTAYADGILKNDSSSGNHEARVLVTQMPLSGGSVAGVRLRAHTSSIDAYEFIRVGATSLNSFSVVLRKRIGAAYTNLGGTPTVIARAGLTTPEELYMTVVGTTITCYLNGVQVAAAVDSSISTARNRGGAVVRCSVANDTLIDNFQFGDIGKTRVPLPLAARINISASPKATVGLIKRSNIKIGSSSKAFATPPRRVARFNGRGGNATGAKATSFSTLTEGFRVKRPIIAKIGTSSKAKATITTGNKRFSTKLSQTFAGGGVFHPAPIDIRKGQQGARFPVSNSAKAILSRNVRESAKAFQSAGLTAHFAGGTTHLNGTAPTVSNITASIGGKVKFQALVPTASCIITLEWIFAPGLGGFFTPPAALELPTTLVTKSVGDKLFRHYKARPVGHNVYIYSDGTVSENDPDGYSTLWKESDRTSSTLPNAAHVTHVFWGGHDGEHITEAEATLLTAAGYTVRGFHA